MKHYFTRLEETMRKHWDKAALCNYHGEEFTFGDVATKIERFHLVFEAVGVKKGDKIALCAKNSARWGISFLSVVTYEAVVVPILADFLPESVNHLVDHSESKILFTDPDIWKKLDISKMPNISTVISVADFSILYADDDRTREALASLDDLYRERFPEGVKPEDVHYPVDNDK